MKAHYIQHVHFEGLGYIKTWLKKNGHSISSTKVWKDENFPAFEEFDVLIILGGPMGVYDDLPWLKKEKAFIAEAINKNKAILGICLGAQLIATALGAQVYPNQYKEIGWFQVNFHASFSGWLAPNIPKELIVFHWHGDTFDTPSGAKMHATSKACASQLFTVGDKIIGIQFHLEATTETVKNMLDNENGEIVKAPFIQEKGRISGTDSDYRKSHELLSTILNRLFTTNSNG